MKLSEKEKNLKNIIKEIDSALVSLSGGVDSSLLASVTHEILGDKAISVTAKSPTLPSWDVEGAKKIAEEIGIKHFFLDTKELENKKFVRNSPKRCYYCKKEHLQKFDKFRKKKNIEKILDGTNYTDTKEDRPGLKAIREFGEVVSTPLVKANFTNEDVRELARVRNLSIADNPSTTCLATRILSGEDITREKLNKIEKAEKYLQSLGFNDLRVRNCMNIAIIEVEKSKIEDLINLSEEIAQKIKNIGFNRTSIDLEGR